MPQGDKNNFINRLTHALRHPLRLRILEVTAQRRGRPLSVEALTATLVRTPGYEHTTQSEVKYHRACLHDAQLLPAE